MDQRTEVALWRYQIIAPLVSVSGPRGTLKRELSRLAARPHPHPLKGSVQVGYGTIEEWLYAYRRYGLDGLMPKQRKDRGKSRAIDEALAEEIVCLAHTRPELDGPGILSELSGTFGMKRDALPSLSTLYRFLRAEDLTDRCRPVRRDHRAYSFDFAGDCWQSDVMFGPSIPTREGTRKKTYLLGVLDDATRLIPHAQFYFEQHLPSLKDCLKQALLKRGVCSKLYVDNGKIFRSRAILALTARLGIQLIHSAPYRPQGRAKVERFFGTVRRSFLSRVEVSRLSGIGELNRLLFAWVEGEYHLRPHRGLEGETPLDRWVRLSEGIRPLPAEIDLDRLFLEETTRRVKKDGTLTLKGKTFEAGPLFIGQRVVVKYDPFDLRRVLVTGRSEEETEAFPVDLAANRYVRRRSQETDQNAVTAAPLTSLSNLARRLTHQETDDES